MDHAKIKALREQRAKLVADAQALLKQPSLSKEDEATFDALMAEADQAKAALDRHDRSAQAEQELSLRIEQRAGRDGVQVNEAKATDELEHQVFDKWMRRGMLALTDDERGLMQRRQAADPGIQAAQSVGTTTAGGFLVPQSFSDRLEIALKFFGGMTQVAETIETGDGADMPWPSVNDTTNKGAILAENTQIGTQDIAFTSITLKAFMYTSKLILVSWQLMQDSFVSMENLVADLAGQRVGRILNEHFTVGAGTTEPKGIVTAAASGKVGLVGQTVSAIWEDLVDLVYSVDVAYRPNGKFMMADSSMKIVQKLKDSTGRPLWEPSFQAGSPDTFMGYPVIINNDMAVMAANAKSILFGDLTKYKIRKVRGITLVRMNERYADFLQTGFFAFARYDGNLIDAGTSPVKFYQNSAT